MRGPYSLQVVWGSQPAEIRRGDLHPFARYW